MRQFNKRLFKTGKFDVQTRSGHQVTDIEITTVVAAKIPDLPDCRGRNRYGFLMNGRRKETETDPLDLVLIPKS